MSPCQSCSVIWWVTSAKYIGVITTMMLSYVFFGIWQNQVESCNGDNGNICRKCVDFWHVILCNNKMSNVVLQRFLFQINVLLNFLFKNPLKMITFPQKYWAEYLFSTLKLIRNVFKHQISILYWWYLANIDHFRMNRSVISAEDLITFSCNAQSVSCLLGLLCCCCCATCSICFFILHVRLWTSCEVSEHIKIRCAVHQWLFVIPFLRLLLRRRCGDLGS